MARGAMHVRSRVDSGGFDHLCRVRLENCNVPARTGTQFIARGHNTELSNYELPTNYPTIQLSN